MYHVSVPTKTKPRPVETIFGSIDFKDIESESNYMLDNHTMFGIVNDDRDSSTFFLRNLDIDQQQNFGHVTRGLPEKYDELILSRKLTYMQASSAIKPDRTKIASVSYFSPYISVISTDGDEKRTVSVEDINSNYKVDNANFEEKLRTVFESVSVTDKYIYVVYNDQVNEEVAEIGKPVEIWVFDWDLNPVRRFAVNEYILSMGVSLDDLELIGIDYTEEKIYRYRLPDEIY